MTFPHAPEGDAAPAGVVACSELDCERPVVFSAAYCRVHLAEAMRRDGEVIGFDDPELAGLLAAAVQIVRTALTGISSDLLDPSAARSAFDLYALLDRDANWGLAHRVLDLLGAQLSDEFGFTRLWPPTEYMSMVMLQLRVAVPAPAADELRDRLRFGLEALIHEVLEPGAASFAVVPTEESGEVVAVIQAFFPRDLDLTRFAEHFSTRLLPLAGRTR
jgi:hypothetical protein